MKKLWSISTTVRNPERIRDFLFILKKIEGEEWNKDIQAKYQVLLLQNRLYGYENIQFKKNLSENHLALIDSKKTLTYNQAKEILISKDYEGGLDMRGRQSFNPLKKMGLTFIDEEKKLRISAVGNYFLKESYDLGNIFFKSFIKWQLPNFDASDFKEEDGYNIKPFVGTLHLIKKVNEKWKALENKPVGISKTEFSIFIPALINYKDINKTAEKIIKFRKKLKTISKKEREDFIENFFYNHIKQFLNTDKESEIKKIVDNAKDYTDNIIRYFRLTRFIYIRGNGYYIDLEPRRKIEIDLLLKNDLGKCIKFKNKKEYIEFLSDINQPLLAWETKEHLQEIISNNLNETEKLETELDLHKEPLKYENFNIQELKNYIEDIRNYRRELQEKIDYKKAQGIDELKEYIEILENINSEKNRPLVLEKYITLGLNALNDSLKIQGNYLVGDDNEPINTAPAGKPDIECFYNLFNSICEVTMLTRRDQWYNEGQPVMRHLRDFETKYREKETFCLFIAPSIHRDTLNTFWTSVRYEYEGNKQRIIPLTINQFIHLLKILLKTKENKKPFTHNHILDFYNSNVEIDNLANSQEWLNRISANLNNLEEVCL